MVYETGAFVKNWYCRFLLHTNYKSYLIVSTISILFREFFNSSTFISLGLETLLSVNFKNKRLNFSTDLKKSIAVNYTGILPDLFKENAGVVATGYFDKNKMSLDAYQILAKHDENYVPKEVKKALEKWFQK